MNECTRYILVCAGEDSGDSIGESLVKAIVADAHWGAVGAGGARMQAAGLRPIVDYETLPVSGFGDVVPKYFKLRQSFNQLKTALESPNCVGLIAIDYPGFNMKLVARAGELRKPSLYVAPPQVWAWKRKRAKELAKNPFVKLAVFFEFEETVYREVGCDVVRVQHPFVNSKIEIQNDRCANGATRLCSSEFERDSRLRPLSEPQTILLPGSRKSQALRNLPIYLKAIHDLQNVLVIAARKELVPAFEKFGTQVVVAPQNVEERKALYQAAQYAITAPGTATLELALAGCPMMVCTKPDMLTYCLGRLFVRTKYFALPNIIMNRLVFPEYIVAPWENPDALRKWIAPVIPNACNDPGMTSGLALQAELREKLNVGKTLEQLALEFLGQFV